LPPKQVPAFRLGLRLGLKSDMLDAECVRIFIAVESIGR